MSLQELKSNFIVDVAEKLFFERSIFNVTIKDIAERAEVGEMTVYRHFSCCYEIRERSLFLF